LHVLSQKIRLVIYGTLNKLWLEKTPPNYMYGNGFGVWEAETQIITRWNYQEIINQVNSIADA